MNQNKRDSFDERICDDLCEEILKYLPLKDKLKLESVSKQFQKTIFQKQYELKIYYKNYKPKDWISQLLLHEEDYIILKSFESLLKKCQNLTSIKFMFGYCFNFNETIQLIIKYCHHIIAFKFHLWHVHTCWNQIRDKTFKQFEQKFGTKLKLFEGFKDVKGLISFPNIEKLRIKPDNIMEDLLEIELKNLIKLSLFPKDKDVLRECLQKYEKLRYLYLFFNINLPNNDDSDDSVHQILNNLPKLNYLIEFEFDFAFDYSSTKQDFTEFFKQLPNKFPMIKSLILNLYITEESDFEQLLSPLKAFKRLKRFELNLSSKNINISNWFSFQLFKDLSNITYLSLSFDSLQILNISFIKDIDTYLPELQFLEIVDFFIYNDEKQVEQMADILSRLSKLQTLKLTFTKKTYYYKIIETKLIQKCRKFKSLINRNISSIYNLEEFNSIN